mgnify:CR=1 FL=1
MGTGQILPAIAEMAETFLLVQRDGIVDFGADARVFQPLLEFVTLRATNHILMKNVGPVRQNRGGRDEGKEAGRFEIVIVSRGVLTA